MGLKDLDVRVRLPWKDNPREAKKLYEQICRSKNPEEKAKQIKRELGL